MRNILLYVNTRSDTATADQTCNNATPEHFDKGEAFEIGIKILQEKRDNNKEHCRGKTHLQWIFRTTTIHSPAFPVLMDEKWWFFLI